MNIPAYNNSYLEDSRIQNLVGDAKGNIWGTTQYDVFRISPGGDITIVGNRDQDYYEYNTNSDGVLEDGTVVFGTGHRLFFFNAEAETPEIPLFMEGILVNRERFVPAQGQTIRFNHRDDHLDFYFSGRNFDPGVKVVYQYQLEGQDRTWLNAGSDLHAGYSRLGAGKYTFRVRTLLPDGRTGKEQLVQTIQVMLRTQEIKVSDAAVETEGADGTPAETDNGHDSVWDRILELFSGIKNDIAALFHRDAEEAAEL